MVVQIPGCLFSLPDLCECRAVSEQLQGCSSRHRGAGQRGGGGAGCAGGGGDVGDDDGGDMGGCGDVRE